jgi:hypothetical protein
MIKKIAPLMFAAVAMSSAAGCSTEMAPEMTAEESAAVCENPDGTNAAIAALAVAISQELHRWQITSDFYVYSGYQGVRMLGLTQAGKNACGGSCPLTENILMFQDPRMNEKIVFNGTKLKSHLFNSRLLSGYDKQVTCQQGRWCQFEWNHMFGYNSATTQPGACDTLFTFTVSKPGSLGGGPLTQAQISSLNNALVWTAANGPNPYIAFEAGTNKVTIDPTGNVNPPGQTTGSEICQKASLTNINYTPCTCAANNIYSNGKLRNDEPLTPRTYYCRQF